METQERSAEQPQPDRSGIDRQIYGTGSHLHILEALDGVDHAAAGARPAGSPHSIFQITEHMSYWQAIALGRIRSEPHAPAERAADGWTATIAPPDSDTWKSAVTRLRSSLLELEPFAGLECNPAGADPETVERVRKNLFMLRGHNAYHIGQIALLRRMLGCWPPAGGGDTW